MHTTTQQIVEMRADEEVQDSKPLFERVTVSKPYKDTLEHTVKDILNRPYLIQSFSWSASAQNSKTLAVFHPAKDLMDKTNVKNKISGFKYARFGIKLRVMCNFTPVQVGKLLVAAIPTVPGGYYVEGGQYSLYQLSTCRHVEVDAGSQEEVEIELPFYNDFSVYDIDSNDANWCVIVKVLNHLGGASNNEVVDVNIYASFQDIDLALPVGQSATEGDKKVEKGIISSTLDTASEVAGSLSKIPVLSDIAGPVSWAASAAAGAASFFGFSKPYNEGITQRVTVQPGSSLANVDGIDTSIKLSALTNNSVQQLDGEDEMNISQIAKRQGLIGQSSWDFSHKQFDTLYSCRVRPAQPNFFAAEILETAIQGQKINIQPPVSFLAGLFVLWRGDMSFRFSFAKNEFYTGKVMVTFRPSTRQESDNHEDNVYRRIISIKNTNDFVVTVPYIYHKHWANYSEDIGLLEVSVFNRLQATSIVPQTIDFNVWAFSNNISFAYPATDLPVTFFQPDPQAHVWPLPTSALASKREPIAIGQSIQSSDVDQTAHDDYLFRTEGTEEPEKYTTGEIITNLRPLTRRFNAFESSASIRVSSASFTKDYELDLDKLSTHPHHTETLLEYLGGMFLFKRGGLRFKGYTGKSNGVGYVQQKENTKLSEVGGVYDPNAGKSGASAMTLNSVNGVLETEVPFYCDRERWFTAFNLSTVSLPGFAMGFLNENMDFDKSNKRWFVAGADDFTFSFYQGVPGVVDSLYYE